MGDDVVQLVRHAIGIVLMSHLIAGLLQGTTQESVFGIHDGRLGVVARLFLDAAHGHHAGLANLTGLGQGIYDLPGLFITLKQLNGQPTGTIAQTQQVVAFQEFLNIGNSIFYLMSMLDVLMAIILVVSLAVLKDMYHLAKQFLQSSTSLKRCGNHRHTQQRTEFLDVQLVATTFQFVKHVQRTNHT